MNSGLFRLIPLAAFVLMLTPASAHAQTPQEFGELVQQLQATPNDEALRDRVIASALTLAPSPVVPEEARRFMARGTAAFETAADVEGFKLAAREFQAAANAAPWLGDAYFNLGKANEKAGDNIAAIAAYKHYLAAAPAAADAGSVQTQVYKLEFLAEQKSKADAALAAVEAEKANRQAIARAVVDDLTRNYGGVIYQASTCRVSGRGCLPAEESGNNWYGILDENTTNLTRLGMRYLFQISGPNLDQVTMSEPGNPLNGPRSFCAKPTTYGLNELVWTPCNTPPQPGSTTWRFGRTSAGQAVITQTDCWPPTGCTPTRILLAK